jgi:cell division protein FtsB
MRHNELQRQKAVLEEKREELEIEIEELTFLLDQPVDYDYIVRVAREKLGLHLPDEIVYYNDYNEAE